MGELLVRPDDGGRAVEEVCGLIDIEGLLAKGCSSSKRIGIGLPRRDSLALGRELRKMGAGVEVRGFEDGSALVTALATNQVDAAVRGVLGSSEVLAALKSRFRLRQVMRCALLGDCYGRQFMLAPVGIDEGMSARSRLEIALETVRYFSMPGWKISCGVLSKGRTGDASRGEEIKTSLRDGERIASQLRKAGVAAEHHEILIEDAVRKCDFLLAPDGVSGNLIFRTLHFLGAGKAYGAPVVNLGKVFVDTSRAKAEFSDSVLLAAGLAETRRGRPKRA